MVFEVVGAAAGSMCDNGMLISFNSNCHSTVAQAVKRLTYGPGIMSASPGSETLTLSPPT